MKYDSDLIEAIYLIKQTNPELAERMWDRLVDPVQNKNKDFVVGQGLIVPESIVLYLQRNHNRHNKVQAIKALREQTGWGLYDSKKAVDLMIEYNMLG